MRGTVALLGALVIVGTLRGQELTRVTTLAGDSMSMTSLTSVDGQSLAATLPDGSPRTLQLDELESIVLGASTPSADTSNLPLLAGHAWLRSGIESPALLVSGDEQRARVQLAHGEPVDVPWAHLRALRLVGVEGEDAAMFTTALGAPLATDDILLARGRDGRVTRLSLRVLGIVARDLLVEFRGERREIPLNQVLGIVLGTENGAAPAPLPLPTVRVEFAPGVSWSGKLEALDESTLRLRLADGPALTLKRSAVRALTVRSSRVLWLSTAEPKKVEQTAALDVQPLLLRDAAPGGSGLVLGDRSFQRGLCLVPRTQLTFALEPDAFRIFEATIGIDQRSMGPADAVFRVRLDDALVFEREHVKRGVIEELRIPLRDAKTLTLEVDFGDHFDLGDHCVFAGARLLKT